MNSLMKKMVIFLVVMLAVATAGWFGRKAYKRAAERRCIQEAVEHMEQKEFRQAGLCLRRAMQINPMSVEGAKKMAELLESVGVPAAVSWRIRASQIETNNVTARLDWAQTAIKFGD